MNTSDEITSIFKGKVSLAEALKEIDVVKKSFEISEKLVSKLDTQEEIIRELQEKSDMYASYGFVVTKFEETKQSVMKIIKDKFEDFSTNYFSQLNEKLNRNEIENYTSNRCTWVAFNSLTQNVGSLKSRIDKHIFSDFEGLKTKVKVQFGDKYSEIISENVKIKDELTQMKMRLTVVEQKIHEMFVDDGLGDSEDYDSQEENDNIMQNLNNKDSLESDEDEGKNETSKPNITIIEARRDSLVNQENKTISAHPDPVQTTDFKLVNTGKVVEEAKIPEEIKEVPIIIDPKPVVLTPQTTTEISKTESIPRPEVLKPQQESLVTLSSEVKPEPQFPVPVTESQKPPLHTQVQTTPNKIPEHPKPPGSEHGSASRNNALEIPDRAPVRRREDDTSSRHRKNSSGDQALSRKNSLSSSQGYGGGGVNGGMRGMNKKLTSLQKDLETFKGLIDTNKLTIDEMKEEFGKIYEKIDIVRQRCEEIENNRQTMELSFIKALRRSGKDKKTPTKPQGNAINTKDLKKIHDLINEKYSKITTVEVQMDKVTQDMEHIKGNFKDKINDIINSLKGLDSFRKDSLKGSTDFSTKLNSIDEKIFGLQNVLNKELQIIKGPMSDLISDQQREKEILEENLKRQQATFRDIVDECSLSMKNIIPETFLQSRISTARPNTRKTNDSPRVSVKHKFYETNNAYRISNPNLKTDENWLSVYPDGRSLALPKVGVKKSDNHGSNELKKGSENESKKL
ncbi:hypothetical protein SteCoe_24916 [Stentor coeruleus]|uniref:Uncharacterized protein n=1 Tax=Stentor coeruleus TaxID=5963 RepID=A0A1R2BGK1_9CILI|nr:hypothetical protein SteCoe_24916 [Stentor coeruleus]